MRTCLRDAAIFLFLSLIAVVLAPLSSLAQAGATSGMILGTVTDPSGAVVAGATVTIQNPVTQYERSTTRPLGNPGFGSRAALFESSFRNGSCDERRPDQPQC